MPYIYLDVTDEVTNRGPDSRSVYAPTWYDRLQEWKLALGTTISAVVNQAPAIPKGTLGGIYLQKVELCTPDTPYVLVRIASVPENCTGPQLKVLCQTIADALVERFLELGLWQLMDDHPTDPLQVEAMNRYHGGWVGVRPSQP